MIEDLFDDFLHFFFPTFLEEVAFSKAPEFLDKDLATIFPVANQRN